MPVLRRQVRRPSRRSASPSRTDAGSPLRPAGYRSSPQWMRPFRNVPVVMMVAPARSWRPSRSLRPRDAAPAAFVGRIFQDQVDYFCLLDVEVGLILKHLAHLHAIELLVALGSGAPDGGAAGSIEEAKLDAYGVGDLTHDSAERVDLADEVPLGDAANGGVAGHLGDQVEVHGNDGGLQAHAGGCHGCFATGVPGADYGDVEFFGKTHGFSILRISQSSCGGINQTAAGQAYKKAFLQVSLRFEPRSQDEQAFGC